MTKKGRQVLCSMTHVFSFDVCKGGTIRTNDNLFFFVTSTMRVRIRGHYKRVIKMMKVRRISVFESEIVAKTLANNKCQVLKNFLVKKWIL